MEGFKNTIKTLVEKKMGEGYTISLNNVTKNNGIILTGLSIMEDGCNISPTIYLDALYAAYEVGQMTEDEVVEDIIRSYERNKTNRQVDMRQFFNYEFVKDKIVYKLVNKEKNAALLKQVPYIEYLDLAIIFNVLISSEKMGQATILIRNEHCKLWGVDSEQIYKQACLNTPNLMSYTLMRMKDVIEEMMGEIPAEAGDMSSVPMYVLTNEKKVSGAGCILYPDLLADFSKAAGSFFILPSSIHEVLLLPTESKEDVEEMKLMVQEINRTQVQDEEVLSDSVYFYDAESNKLSIA